ncbi:MAG TPA: hypothetical protein VLE70_03115 [Anaerolineae bacterium]|nr:hypothetical protein [Anaerolineae bacterium]
MSQGVGLAKVPILAKEAVQGAALVEDGQVVFAGLRAPWADPVGNTIGGQRIAIPVQDTSSGGPGNVAQTTITDGPQAAEAALLLPDHAFVGAKGAARSTGRPRWLLRQVEQLARAPVSRTGLEVAGLLAGAVRAEFQSLRHERLRPAA